MKSFHNIFSIPNYTILCLFIVYCFINLLNCKQIMKQYPILISCIFLMFQFTLQFDFKALDIKADTLVVSKTTTYTFKYDRSTDNSNAATNYQNQLVPAGTEISVLFPAQFSLTNVTYQCYVKKIIDIYFYIDQYDCFSNGNQIRVTGIFSDAQIVKFLTLQIKGIKNPDLIVKTGQFIGKIGQDIAQSNGLSRIVTAIDQSSKIIYCLFTARLNGQYYTAQLRIYTSLQTVISSGGFIKIQAENESLSTISQNNIKMFSDNPIDFNVDYSQPQSLKLIISNGTQPLITLKNFNITIYQTYIKTDKLKMKIYYNNSEDSLLSEAKFQINNPYNLISRISFWPESSLTYVMTNFHLVIAYQQPIPLQQKSQVNITFYTTEFYFPSNFTCLAISPKLQQLKCKLLYQKNYTVINFKIFQIKTNETLQIVFKNIRNKPKILLSEIIYNSIIVYEPVIQAQRIYKQINFLLQASEFKQIKVNFTKIDQTFVSVIIFWQTSSIIPDYLIVQFPTTFQLNDFYVQIDEKIVQTAYLFTANKIRINNALEKKSSTFNISRIKVLSQLSINQSIKLKSYSEDNQLINQNVKEMVIISENNQKQINSEKNSNKNIFFVLPFTIVLLIIIIFSILMKSVFENTFVVGFLLALISLLQTVTIINVISSTSVILKTENHLLLQISCYISIGALYLYNLIQFIINMAIMCLQEQSFKKYWCTGKNLISWIICSILCLFFNHNFVFILFSCAFNSQLFSAPLGSKSLGFIHINTLFAHLSCSLPIIALSTYVFLVFDISEPISMAVIDLIIVECFLIGLSCFNLCRNQYPDGKKIKTPKNIKLKNYQSQKKSKQFMEQTSKVDEVVNIFRNTKIQNVQDSQAIIIQQLENPTNNVEQTKKIRPRRLAKL